MDASGRLGRGGVGIIYSSGVMLADKLEVGRTEEKLKKKETLSFPRI